jgi:5-aminovalerate/4-aminobutyrate aminotransferase
VTDVEGREFIDFAGGIAVLNTGHVHPKVIAAVTEQLNKLTHTCFQVLAYEPYVELCEKINAKVPGDFAKKTLLVTTGSEAVENAVKIARAATGRAGVIAFTGAYHGRTMMTLGLTGKVVPYSAGMGLMPGGVFRALYPNELHGVSVDDSIASIERIFKNDAEPRDIAAIIIEPVQGEGGFCVAPKELHEAPARPVRPARHPADRRRSADRRWPYRYLLRHGTDGRCADLTTFAKSIAGGFPLAGVCGKAEYMDAIAPGGLGGTYAGSPIACAAALAVMEVFEEEKLLDRCKAVGERLVTGLKAIQAKYPVIGDVRALGAMIAVELFEGDSHKPNAAAVGRCGQGARQGPDPAVLRHLRQRPARPGTADRRTSNWTKVWRSSKSASLSSPECDTLQKKPASAGFFMPLPLQALVVRGFRGSCEDCALQETAVSAPTVPRVSDCRGRPLVRDMLSEMLLSVRCDARLVCADGQQALSAAGNKPDLIIAARELPGSMASTCCAGAPAGEQSGLPFILMSNRTDSASVREALRCTHRLPEQTVELDNLRKRLEDLLVRRREIACPVPALPPGSSCRPSSNSAAQPPMAARCSPTCRWRSSAPSIPRA